MSRPLVPRLPSAELNMNSSHVTQKPKKISTACGACKQRKTKVRTSQFLKRTSLTTQQCSGTTPCDACGTRGSACIYDVTTDQRRKIANQKNIQELSETQNNLERHRQLLGGIIAIFRAGSVDTAEALVASIRSGVDLSQLAAHVRNARRASPAINSSFADIEFVIDGPEELPSPAQILNTTMPSQASFASMNPLSDAGRDGVPSMGTFLGYDQNAEEPG